jgi:hypothetical protein
LALTMAAAAAGCSKKQVIPGILAGTGAAAMVGGVAYRVSLPEEDAEGLLGRQPQQKAGVAILLFAGAALVLAGIIWSATTPMCDSDADCWGGESCNEAAGTCVPRPAGTESRPAEPVSLMTDRDLRAPSHVPERFALRLYPSSL